MSTVLLAPIFAWIGLMVVLAGLSVWLRRRRRGRRKEDKLQAQQ